MAEHTGRDTSIPKESRVGLKRMSAKPVRGGEAIKTHRNFLTGLGTMFPDGCHAGYSSDDKKKEVPLSEDRTQDPEPL